MPIRKRHSRSKGLISVITSLCSHVFALILAGFLLTLEHTMACPLFTEKQHSHVRMSYNKLDNNFTAQDPGSKSQSKGGFQW